LQKKILSGWSPEGGNHFRGDVITDGQRVLIEDTTELYKEYSRGHFGPKEELESVRKAKTSFEVVLQDLVSRKSDPEQGEENLLGVKKQ